VVETGAVRTRAGTGPNVNGAADPAAGPVTAAVTTGRLPLFFSAGAAAEAALEAAESSCLKMDGNAFIDNS
jgi:hypothetical protein